MEGKVIDFQERLEKKRIGQRIEFGSVELVSDLNEDGIDLNTTNPFYLPQFSGTIWTGDIVAHFFKGIEEIYGRTENDPPLFYCEGPEGKLVPVQMEAVGEVVVNLIRIDTRSPIPLHTEPETRKLLESVLNPSGGLRSSISCLTEGEEIPTLLSLVEVSTVYIEKEYRGLGFGLKAVKSIIQRFLPLCDLVLVNVEPEQSRMDQAFPDQGLSYFDNLRFKKSLGLDIYNTTPQQGEEKIRQTLSCLPLKDIGCSRLAATASQLRTTGNNRVRHGLTEVGHR